MATLVSNRYGKSRVRVLKVDKNPGKHVVHDFQVQVLFEGGFSEAYEKGNNATVVPTDTMKNTCYVIADQHKFSSPEEYSLILGKHFLRTYSWVDRVQIDVVQTLWERMSFGQNCPHEHSFSRTSPETRLTSVIHSRTGGVQIESGMRDLVVMKTTQAGFTGYFKDKYTTLGETNDRIFATAVSCKWRYGVINHKKGIDFNRAWETVHDAIYTVFANTYSKSVQETEMKIATEILRCVPEIDEVSLSMPNKHSIAFNLEPFGLKNTNTVFQSIDDPSGLIESVVARTKSKL